MYGIERLFEIIPALAALKGWERFKAEEAISNLITDAIDEATWPEIEVDGDDDPDPRDAAPAVPIREAA